MAINPIEIRDKYNNHVNSINPHNVNYKKIEGLSNVNNTSDEDKPVTNSLLIELNKKLNISDIYNSTEDDATKDLTKIPWSAGQGYSMKNVINAYESQDISEIEERITWCENNV